MRRYGSAARGILRGPWVWNLDFNMFKTWNLLGRENGPYLKAEFYSTNFLNHNNTASPLSLNIADANFGQFLPSGRRTIYFRFRVGF